MKYNLEGIFILTIDYNDYKQLFDSFGVESLLQKVAEFGFAIIFMSSDVVDKMDDNYSSNKYAKKMMSLRVDLKKSK